MTDKVYESFLQRQWEEGRNLARQSDILRLTPFVGDAPDRYVVDLRCKVLRENARGVSEGQGCAVGIWFPPDYLRQIEVAQVISLLAPADLFHPNVRFPFICMGRLTAGTTLVDILHQLFEIVTYQKVTMREDDALNPRACQWARNQLHRFPLENRPLKRRRVGGDPT